MGEHEEFMAEEKKRTIESVIAENHRSKKEIFDGLDRLENQKLVAAVKLCMQLIERFRECQSGNLRHQDAPIHAEFVTQLETNHYWQQLKSCILGDESN